MDRKEPVEYGEEIIIDIHDAAMSRFTRANIEEYCKEVSDALEMTRCDLHFWDDEESEADEVQTNPKTKGTTAVQFWLESNLTIHTLDLLGRVYINVFTCKKGMAVHTVEKITHQFFGGRTAQIVKIVRV